MNHPAFQSLFVAILFAAVLGCQSPAFRGEPSTYQLLNQTKADLTTAVETLEQAVALGVVDTDSKEYWQVHRGLEQAKDTLALAWADYFKGDHLGAESTRRVAVGIYGAVRPLLYKLAGSAP